MKKTFTLIEILIVIIIIGVIAYSFRNFFSRSAEDQGFINSQTCFNYIYGDIKNYVDNATTGKGFWTGNNWVYPDRYLIKVYKTLPSIDLVYNAGSDVVYKEYHTDQYNGIKKDACFNETYYVKLSDNTDISSMSINRLLSSDTNTSSVMMTGDTSNAILTGQIFLKYCMRGTNKCKDIGKILIDKRTQKITRNICLEWTNNDVCKKWSISEG